MQKDGVLKIRKLRKLVLNAIAESGITEGEEKLSTIFEEKVSWLTFLHFISFVQLADTIEYDFSFKVFVMNL